MKTMQRLFSLAWFVASLATFALWSSTARAQSGVTVVPVSADPGSTTNDLFASAVVNAARSTPAYPGSSLGDIFGAKLSSTEPGNGIFQNSPAGTVCSLYFSLPTPTNFAEVAVWVVNDRGMSHFALKLLDAASNVVSTLAETDLHFPYTDLVAAGGYGSVYVKLIASFPTVTGQHFLAQFTQAVNAGARVLEMDAYAQATAPTVISSNTATGREGSAFSYRIWAGAGVSTFNATGLPAGLTVNTNTGVISGTPTVFGEFNVTLTVANAAGTNTAPLALTILQRATVQILPSSDPGGTTNDLFAKAIPNGALSSPTPYGLYYLSDIFGTALSYEPGNTVFQDGAAGAVSRLYFSLPTPTNLAEVVVWVVNDRGMSHFALRLLDSANTVMNTITETDIHFPYTDPVASGGYESFYIKVMASFPPITGQYFLAEFTQAGVHGTRVIEMDANAQPSVPTVISAAALGGQEGTPFSYRITPSAITTFYDALGLPAGLTVNHTNGFISGTPLVPGKFNTTLLVGNAAGTNTAPLLLTIMGAATFQIASSPYPGNTTNDLFGKAIANPTLSSPTHYNFFYLQDIFGSATGNFEPGNCVFADHGLGGIASVCFRLPAPVTFSSVSAWFSDDRAASRFVLKLADTNYNVIGPIAETDLHLPYTDSAASGGYGGALIKVTATFPPVTGQYFVAQFTQARAGLGLRAIELDANSTLPVAQGLRLWLDAGNLNAGGDNPADSAPVTLWRDLSGLGLDATPLFGAAPVYRTNALNGLPGVDFGLSGSDALATALSSQLNFTNCTILMVGNQASQPTHVSLSAPTITQEFILGDKAIYHHSSAYHWANRTHQDSPTGYYIQAGLFGTRSNELANCINGVFSTSAIALGQQPGVPDYSPVPRQAILGWRNSDALGNPPIAIENFGGVICEVLVYDHLLTGPELDAVQLFLSQKYGLAVTPIPPMLRPVAVVQGKARFEWDATRGRAYQVQYSTNLNSALWLNLGDAFAPTNSVGLVEESPVDAQRFYRVLVQ